jgi:hypothetical protein
MKMIETIIYKEREDNMSENKLEQCNICKEEYTSTHVEVLRGVKVYACKSCLEATKDNFIWICINCGRVYIRPKDLMISRINNYEVKRNCLLYRDLQIIIGIDMCIGCNPEGIVNYMNKVKMAVV